MSPTIDMSTNLERLLRALPRPALLRVARAYGCDVEGRLTREALAGQLVSLAQIDVQEVVLELLRQEELERAARELGLSTEGTRLQLARRLASALRWRPFEQAREEARALGLESVKAWRRWAKESCPQDVPPHPDHVYRELGWKGWGDWLGTGRLATRGRTFRDFEDARAFVHTLALASESEWHAWCQGKRPDLPPRPDDLPVIPHRTYAAEWKGVGDWLGTGRVQTQRRVYRPFAAARALARSLGLKGQDEYFEWWRRSGAEALDVPRNPSRTYAGAWRGWGDFLGTGNVGPSDRVFLPFEVARAYARGLGVTCLREWNLWVKGELPGKPVRSSDVPTNPWVVYRGRGWRGLGDWLGTGNVRSSDQEFWPFERARAFVRALELRSAVEWKAWCAGRLPGKPPRPPELPTNPNRTYAREWVDLADWLGEPPGGRRRWRAFEEARAFARSLGLRSTQEWKAYAAGRWPELPPKPADVPASPAAVYTGQGWAGFTDWLGSSTAKGACASIPAHACRAQRRRRGRECPPR